MLLRFLRVVPCRGGASRCARPWTDAPSQVQLGKSEAFCLMTDDRGLYVDATSITVVATIGLPRRKRVIAVSLSEPFMRP